MRIACVMMQKNEDLLLEPWIRYHGYLFGIDNLFVFDNGSTSEVAKQVLARFERIGLNVDREHNSKQDFDAKGVIVGRIIRQFQNDRQYDGVFAIDCDEFVAVSTNNGVSCLRREILCYLNTLSQSTAMIRVGHCLDNRPGFADLYRFATFRKSFILVPHFRSIDHGFHEPSSLSEEAMTSSRIIFIHMHFKPFDLVKRHALDKLSPFVDVSDPQAVAAFRGVGVHLVRYFGMSEEEYYSDIGEYRYPLIGYTQFAEVLGVLMRTDDFLASWCVRPAWLNRASIERDIVDLPGDFCAPDYLEANIDVARSGMDPTLHYCLFGFREKRPLRKR